MELEEAVDGVFHEQDDGLDQRGDRRASASYWAEPPRYQEVALGPTGAGLKGPEEETGQTQGSAIGKQTAVHGDTRPPGREPSTQTSENTDVA